MTLRLRMLLINQFNHLIEELDLAYNELNSIIKPETKEDANLKSINADIYITKKRVEEFKIKSIKEFEKRHTERLKELRIIKRNNKKNAK